MKIYHLVFDGSHSSRTNMIGLGYVDYTNGKVVHVDSVGVKAPDDTNKKSLFAEAMAACAALDYAEKGSIIYIYGDNKDVIKLLQGGHPHEHEFDIKAMIDQSVGRHASVIAKHISETDKTLIPYKVFALAHNASAQASGSKKREPIEDLQDPFKATKAHYPQAHDGMQIIEPPSDNKRYPRWDPRSPDFKP
jgi:ribonuclease HI